MQIIACIFIVLALGIIVAMFVRGRVSKGVPAFKLTEKDRVELAEFRREFGIRRILARLVGFLAGILFVGGVLSLLRRDASWSVDRTIAVAMVVLSLALVLCAWLLVRKDNSGNEAP